MLIHSKTLLVDSFLLLYVNTLESEIFGFLTFLLHTVSLSALIFMSGISTMVKYSYWSENLVLIHTSKRIFLNFLKSEVFYILLLDLISTHFSALFS